MKLKTVILLVLVVSMNAGCDSLSSSFKMPVEEVYELNGVILKGIYIAGTIKSGCIANGDIYIVERDGEKLLEQDARIMEVSKQPGTKAAKGDYVKLYVPDRNKEDVKLGDMVISGDTSC